jgi:D-3-phosphoglycerate dehydrogenase
MTDAPLAMSTTVTGSTPWQVCIADPDIDLAVAARILAPAGAEPVRQHAGWSGPALAALVVSPAERVTAADLDRCPNLKVVVTTSVGCDNIDTAACRQRDVTVWHPTDYCSTEVADSAIAHLASLLRGVTLLDRTVSRGEWDYAAAGTLRRFDTTRLGIVGFGTIGRKVAARALSLGMHVAAHDSVADPRSFAQSGVHRVDLEELFTTSNAISLHVPLTPQTQGLIGQRLLGLLPEGAVLVNLARGAVIDMPALLAALDSGRLAAAALDVLPAEPPTQAAPAPVHPRLVITPHAAWYSEQAADELFRRPLEVIRDILLAASKAPASTKNTNNTKNTRR